MKESIQRSVRQNPKELVCYGVLNKMTLYTALELPADLNDVFQNDLIH